MVETMWFNLPNVLEDRVVSLENEVELDISAGNIFSFEEKLRLQVEEEKEKEKREKQRYEILMSLFVCLIQIMAMCVFITHESYFFERHEMKKLGHWTWIYTQLRIILITFISTKKNKE
jgi:hypothetical protein